MLIVRISHETNAEQSNKTFIRGLYSRQPRGVQGRSPNKPVIIRRARGERNQIYINKDNWLDGGETQDRRKMDAHIKVWTQTLVRRYLTLGKRRNTQTVHSSEDTGR
ncbi:hypothetical protein BgiMline_011345 [Biomphalaria glabrata]|nr:hypothetical protein BgiMline_033687 [Biomphalaria glabrata]